MAVTLPGSWPAWDGRQRAICLLHLAFGTIPSDTISVRDRETADRILRLAYPDMRAWVEAVAPLLENRHESAGGGSDGRPVPPLPTGVRVGGSGG